MPNTPVYYLPFAAELPLSADHTDFARRTSAHLDAQPLTFGPGETMHAQYLEALDYLVRTHLEARQVTVWDTYADQLPHGVALVAATPDGMRVATVALCGLAHA